MPSDDIETLLARDFERMVELNEQDAFLRKLTFRLHVKNRARLGVVTFAGGLGAAFAASQFGDIVGLMAPVIPDTASGLLSSGLLTQVAGAMVVGLAVLTTALVMRNER